MPCAPACTARSHSVLATVAVVSRAGASAKITDQTLRSAQGVSWQLREQLVDSLELQASVETVGPLWAINIHIDAELVLR